MKIRPYPPVGVEVYDIDIESMSEHDYHCLSEIFFEHSLVLIRKQPVSPKAFARLCFSIGDITNIGQCSWNSAGELIPERKYLDPFTDPTCDKDFPVQRVTGKKVNGADSGIFGSGVLDWHCNINGVSWAPGVGLQACEGVAGTTTRWMDTTKAYADLSPALKERCEAVIGHFKYAPEIWAEGLPEWQLKGMLRGKVFEYRAPLVNMSATGKKGLYFHFLNECSFPADPELLAILKKHCLNDKYIQTIDWQIGDIHFSNQILTLHRREQNDPAILANRILNRYTFNFAKKFPDQKPFYL